MEKPLVSVIVRTVGRATLTRALRSVLEQHWRPLEVVIVRAGGDRMPELPRSPEVPFRVIEGGCLTRPQAANVGINAANGDWLIFLDDDDRMAPDHIASLVECAMVPSQPLVAYSATACLFDDRIDGVMFEQFDRRRLLTTNYIQIGAALFSRTLVVEGHRFDEAFECMQDWDFWIQLSQRTHFTCTPRATNLWSVDTGDSGMGGGRNGDGSRVAHWRGRVQRKWAGWADWLEGRIAHHARAADAAREADDSQRLADHLAAVERLLHGRLPRSRVNSSRGRMRWPRVLSAAPAIRDDRGA